jgi:RND family efflux transporter MFP subunit
MPKSYGKINHEATRRLFRLNCLAAAVIAVLTVSAIAQNSQDRSTAPVNGAGSTVIENVPAGTLPIQLVPSREAVLSSEVSTPIERMPFRIGDTFKAGDVLVVLDCRELQAKHDYSLADISELRARREGAVAEFAAAQETHVTKLRLQGLGAAGELEVTLAAAASEKARAMVRQLDASIEKAQANVRQTLAQITHCVINAPFAGKVARIRVKERELAAANQPIMDIVDVSSLKVQMFVPAAVVRNMGMGATLALRLNGESRDRTARVTRISPRLDGASQLLEVEAEFVGQANGLIAGTLGNARIVSKGAVGDKRLSTINPRVITPAENAAAEVRVEVADSAEKIKEREQAAERAKQLEEQKVQQRERAAERARVAAEEKARAEELKQKALAEQKQKAQEEAQERARLKAERKEREREQAAERSRLEAEQKAQQQEREAEQAKVVAEEKARAKEQAAERARVVAEEKARAEALKQAALAEQMQKEQERAQADLEERARRKSEAERRKAEQQQAVAEAKARAEADRKIWLEMKARIAKESAEASVQTSPESVDSTAYYVVGKGDTFGGIAAKFKQSRANLRRWNNLLNPDRLRPGQRLRVMPLEDEQSGGSAADAPTTGSSATSSSTMSTSVDGSLEQKAAEAKAQAEADYQVWQEMKARMAREAAEEKAQKAQERARLKAERKEREREQAAERARLAAEERAASEEANRRAQAEADYQVWLEMKARLAREEAEQKFQKSQDRARLRAERKERERARAVERVRKKSEPAATPESEDASESSEEQ